MDIDLYRNGGRDMTGTWTGQDRIDREIDRNSGQ